MIDMLNTCNSCGRPIEHPNPGGYCDSCLAAAEISTRTGLRIWSACAGEHTARSYAEQWAEGGNAFDVAFRPDLSPTRPWIVYRAIDADTVTGWRRAADR